MTLLETLTLLGILDMVGYNGERILKRFHDSFEAIIKKNQVKCKLSLSDMEILITEADEKLSCMLNGELCLDDSLILFDKFLSCFPLEKKKDIEASLRNLIDTTAKDVRRSPMLLSHLTKSMAGRNLLKEVAKNGDTLRKRVRAIFLMGKEKMKQEDDFLIELLDDEELEIKKTTLMSLGKIRSEKAIIKIIPLLEHDDYSIRWEAVNTLMEIQSEDSVLPLIDLIMKETNDKVLYRAIFALCFINSEKIIEPLIKIIIEDDNSEKKRRALLTLLKSRQNEGRELLLGALKDKPEELKMQINEILEKHYFEKIE
ncbi:MAG: hypothetical protein DRG20_07190 [Deltaproteobacteria bacterium]|nr:HEAT repeat domain-containing protein [Deltaproteobacteria bacterium]RLA87697.1 MAG: hypothetical protein DRG20_07190 [Deltaproteobacteria bacterium]